MSLHEDTKLSKKWARLISVLINSEVSDSGNVLAERAGISRATLYRYLHNEEFQRHYKEEIDSYLLSKRGALARSLVKAAETRGPSQVPALNLYYKIQGLIKERVELNASITTNDNSLMVESLPVWLKQLLVIVGCGRPISRELEAKIEAEVGPLYASFEMEIMTNPDTAPKLIGSGNGPSYYEEEEEEQEGYEEEVDYEEIETETYTVEASPQPANPQTVTSHTSHTPPIRRNGHKFTKGAAVVALEGKTLEGADVEYINDL